MELDAGGVKYENITQKLNLHVVDGKFDTLC